MGQHSLGVWVLPNVPIETVLCCDLLWGRYVSCLPISLLAPSPFHKMQFARFSVIGFYSWLVGNCAQLINHHHLDLVHHVQHSELRNSLGVSSGTYDVMLLGDRLLCSSWQRYNPGAVFRDLTRTVCPVKDMSISTLAAQQARGIGWVSSCKCLLWSDHTDHSNGFACL